MEFTRIVCGTAELPLFLEKIGCGDRIVGITSETREPASLLHLPQIGRFIDHSLERILSLEPDLVLLHSNLQGRIAKQCIEKGITVLCLQSGRLREIERSLLHLGRFLGKEGPAIKVLAAWKKEIAEIAERNRKKKKIKVYFEEWDDPMMTGIPWVSEMLRILNAEDIFPEFQQEYDASKRITSAEEVRRRNPDVMLFSWCGKPFVEETIFRRPGWDQLEAVRHRRYHEVDSHLLFLPGLQYIDGLLELERILDEYR
ncbi:cobalamin-binding protein [Bacillaceae bacterium]